MTPTTTEGLAVNALMPFVEAVEEAGGSADPKESWPVAPAHVFRSEVL